MGGKSAPAPAPAPEPPKPPAPEPNANAMPDKPAGDMSASYATQQEAQKTSEDNKGLGRTQRPTRRRDAAAQITNAGAGMGSAAVITG